MRSTTRTRRGGRCAEVRPYEMVVHRHVRQHCPPHVANRVNILRNPPLRAFHDESSGFSVMYAVCETRAFHDLGSGMTLTQP
jgi:hypothetical protein